MKKRNYRWKQERKARRIMTQKAIAGTGIDKEELWNLCDYFAEHILRRLKAFKAMPRVGFPSMYINNGGSEAFEKDLDDMIEGFELYVKGEYWYVENSNRGEDEKKVARAPELFAKLFFDLWD